MGKQSNKDRYTILILGAIGEVLNKDSESEFKIDYQELLQGENMTDFVYALSAVAPLAIYTQITDDKLNLLEFNHLVNKLIFQYAQK